MADSSDSEASFEGFSAEDIGDYLPQNDSDIEVSSTFDSISSSDDEDYVPLGELRARIRVEGRGDERRLDSDIRPEQGENVNTQKWCRNLVAVTTAEFDQTSGPTVTLGVGKREIDFLDLIFTPDIYTLITEQTNLYAQQSQETKPDSKWIDVTVDEMRAFLGLHVLMSFIQLPTYKDYWTTANLFRIPSIPLIMTRVRFEKILQYFHCNNSRINPKKGDPGHDRLHSIRPVFNMVQQNLKSNYSLHQNVAIDEAMIPFRGRLSYRQYLPAKPCKFGIKVWELADSTNGYVYDMQIYTGKSETGQPEGGLASRVVTDLTRELVGKAHHVYMDNFFTSPALFCSLLRDNIYAAGTVRTNRKGWPRQLHSKCLSKKEKGRSTALQDGNLVATCWMDNRQVNFLSTNSDPTSMVSVKRKQKDGTQIELPAPQVVLNYGENMNGVDHGDQIRMQYPTCRRSKKYWKYIFWFLFDTAVASSFILMKESPNHQLKSRKGVPKQRSQLDFRKSIATALIGNYRQKRRYQLLPEDRLGRSHWPVAMPKARRCRQCSLSKVRKQSMYGCSVCDVNLCVTCFEPFHASESPLDEEE